MEFRSRKLEKNSVKAILQCQPVEFAQQLKMAMVEAGQIKQASRKKAVVKTKAYEVTAKGRLTITDFSEATGYKAGAKFALENPRGKSTAWRLVPIS